MQKFDFFIMFVKLNRHLRQVLFLLLERELRSVHLLEVDVPPFSVLRTGVVDAGPLSVQRGCAKLQDAFGPQPDLISVLGVVKRVGHLDASAKQLGVSWHLQGKRHLRTVPRAS